MCRDFMAVNCAYKAWSVHEHPVAQAPMEASAFVGEVASHEFPTDLPRSCHVGVKFFGLI